MNPPATLLPTLILAKFVEESAIWGIIESAFGEDACLQYAGDDSDFSRNIEKIIAERNERFSFYVNFFDLKRAACGGGYILAASDVDFLQSILFEEVEENLNFETRNLLLVVTDKSTDLNFSEFFKRGMHVLEVVCRKGDAEPKAVFNGKNLEALENLRRIPVWPEIPEKTPITVSLFDCPPFVKLDRESRQLTGIEASMLQELLKRVNWKLKINRIRSKDVDRRWPKIYTSVSAGEADLGICSQWQLTTSKSRDLALSQPYSQMCVTFLVPKPSLLPSETFVFQPFRLSTWLAALGAMALLGVVWRLFEPSRSEFFELVRIFCSGCGETPEEPFSRFLVVSWSLACIIMATAYSAGFASSLTSPRYTRQIKTVADILEQRVAVNLSQRTAEVFKPSHDANKRRLPELFSDDPPKRSAQLVKVFGDNYVTDTEAFDEDQKVNLQILQECIATSYLVFVLRKNSPFLRTVDRMLMAFREHGLVEYWQMEAKISRHLSYMGNFFTSYVESYETAPLNAKKMFGCFIWLLIGYVCSSLVFAFEILYKKFLDKKKTA